MSTPSPTVQRLQNHGSGDPAATYGRATNALDEARRVCDDDVHMLQRVADSAVERSRRTGNTFVVFALIFLGLFMLAVRDAATDSDAVVPLAEGSAYLLPAAALALLSGVAMLRYRAAAATAAVMQRRRTFLQRRRQWLNAMSALAEAHEGPTAERLATEVEGHLRADRVLAAQQDRRLPWPGRSVIVSSPDVGSERLPFASDLLRWVSTFVMVFAGLLLVANTLIDNSIGMSVTGATLVVTAGLRLIITWLALVARTQALRSLEHHDNLRSMVTSSDAQLRRRAADLLAPAVDLREGSGVSL